MKEKTSVNINAAFPYEIHARMKMAALRAGLTLKDWLIQVADKASK